MRVLDTYDLVKLLKDYENVEYADGHGPEIFKKGTIGMIVCEAGNAPDGSPPESYEIDIKDYEDPGRFSVGRVFADTNDLEDLHQIDPDHLIYLKSHPEEND